MVAGLMNFEQVEIDLFDRSNFAWTDVSSERNGSCLVATGFDSWAVVQRNGDGWAAVGGLQPKDDKRSARIIAAGDRSVCLARADDWVNEHESAETAHRGRVWARQSPTPKQLTYLPRWARAGDWTRYQASCHLAARFNHKIIDHALALPEREVA